MSIFLLDSVSILKHSFPFRISQDDIDERIVPWHEQLEQLDD
jgi:hypothetical protein